MNFFDSHAHLSPSFNPVYPTLNVSTSSQDWREVLSLSHISANAHPALGLHPWFVDDSYQIQLNQLEELLLHSSCAAIGEIGLDFSSRFASYRLQQMAAFALQLQLANTHALPISVHCVKAHNECLSLLKEHTVIKNGVIHGLGGSIELIQQYVDLGYLIGINGVSLRGNARRYHAMIRHFPLQVFVVETDFPNVLLPNHTESSLTDLLNVIEFISVLKNIPIKEVAEITYNNAANLFLRSGNESTI